MGEKIVGILGGMGPEATAHFFQRLVYRTPARVDQEHLRVLIDSNAKIPDRTESVLSGSHHARQGILDSALLLQEMGAELIVMPCNSAHAYYDDLIARLRVPVLNMIEEVFAAVEAAGLERVGLLATRGTTQLGVYARAAGEIELVTLTEVWMERVHRAIYSVKAAAGRPDEVIARELRRAVIYLRDQGAQGAILGCTELPLVLKAGPDEPLPYFDSTEILVEAVLREALPRHGEGPYN